MKIVAVLAVVIAAAAIVSAAEQEGRIYELRIYTAAPASSTTSHARFRDHT